MDHSTDASKKLLERISSLSSTDGASTTRSSRTTELLERLSNSRNASGLPGSTISDRTPGLSKPAVILSLGSAYICCGFAGEPVPRHVLARPPCTDHVNSQEQLRTLLHAVFVDYLLVNPKERRVVLCEDFLATESELQRAITLLLNSFGVLSVARLPSSPLALLPFGIPTGLVVDCGHADVRVMPVCHGVPVITAWRSISLGARTVQARLKERIIDTCSVEVDGQLVAGKDAGFADELTGEVLEDIINRFCEAEDSTTGPAAHFRLPGGRTVLFDSSIRSKPLDVLFVEGDEEGRTLTSAIVDSVLAAPIDMRAELLSHIVLCGGLAGLASFSRGLVGAMTTALSGDARLSRLSPGIMVPPRGSLVRPQWLTWTGASLYGSFDLLPTCSITKAQWDLDTAHSAYGWPA